jgi:rubredoxin
MDNRCPLCGTPGRMWNRTPQAFRCPNCSSIFSEFGMVLETENETFNLWA